MFIRYNRKDLSTADGTGELVNEEKKIRNVKGRVDN